MKFLLLVVIIFFYILNSLKADDKKESKVCEEILAVQHSIQDRLQERLKHLHFLSTPSSTIQINHYRSKEIINNSSTDTENFLLLVQTEHLKAKVELNKLEKIISNDLKFEQKELNVRLQTAGLEMQMLERKLGLIVAKAIKRYREYKRTSEMYVTAKIQANEMFEQKLMKILKDTECSQKYAEKIYLYRINYIRGLRNCANDESDLVRSIAFNSMRTVIDLTLKVIRNGRLILENVKDKQPVCIHALTDFLLTIGKILINFNKIQNELLSSSLFKNLNEAKCAIDYNRKYEIDKNEWKKNIELCVMLEKKHHHPDNHDNRDLFTTNKFFLIDIS